MILLIFVFDDSLTSNKVIAHLPFFTIMLCDKICIRIAILILINGCAAACDPASAIAIKCIILFEIIGNLRGIDSVVYSVTNTTMKIEFFGIVLIVYCIVHATMAILYVIGAPIDLIALIFAVIHSILPTRDETNATKQS